MIFYTSLYCVCYTGPYCPNLAPESNNNNYLNPYLMKTYYGTHVKLGFAIIITLILIPVLGNNTMAQAPLSLTATVENTSCEGACDGKVTVYPSGGVAPYSYLWSNGDISPIANNMCWGKCQVTVTDNVGTIKTLLVTVDQDFGLTVDIYATDDTGLCNADVLAVPQNGVIPYAYTWSNGGNLQSINGVCSYNYDVLVTDANGCRGKTSIAVPLNIPPVVAIIPNNTPVQNNFVAPATPIAQHSSFPNPFTNKSTISITPSEPLQNVQVQVYDVRGRMVADLHQGPMHSGQVYELNFFPENQPTGVFIYKIIADDLVETGKMFMQ